MNARNFTLSLLTGMAVSLAATSEVRSATVVAGLSSITVTVTAGDLLIPIALPDLTVPSLGAADVKIINDTGAAIDLAALTFSFGPILPPPLALSVTSPDYPADLTVPGVPLGGPGIFDLAAVGPGTYTGTIAPPGEIPDDADLVPDATFVFFYAAGPGGPPDAGFTGLSLLVTPEPGSAMLALVGVVGLLARRRR